MGLLSGNSYGRGSWWTLEGSKATLLPLLLSSFRQGKHCYHHLTEEKFLRLKEIKKLTQDHTAIKKQSWDVNSTIAASRVELLNLSTTDILDWIILCIGVGACPGHCRMFSSIFGFHTSDASSTSFSTSCNNPKCLQTLSDFHWGNKISPGL